MEKIFTQELEKLAPQSGKQNFLLTVSGGADSSVLAYLFHVSKLKFAIAHCNFHLRAEDSNLDMALVRKMANDYQVPYFEKEFDTLSVQKNSGLSVEMVARNLRYEWFKELAPSFDYVVTAHHANDNVETLLLNICRGSGLRGLAAIPPKQGKFIRPMLSFSAAQIREYAAKKNIAYRNDATNFSEDFQRNKIRLSIIPKLEEINPNLLKTISRNIELTRNQYDFYHQQMLDIQSKVLGCENGETFIDKEKLNSYSYKELILNEILSQYGFNSSEVKDLLSVMDNAAGRRFFSSTHLLVVDRTRLLISEIKDIESQCIIIKDIDELSDYGFTVETFDSSQLPVFERNDNCLCVDAGKLKFPLSLRHWQAGDSFHPFGMKGSKKLSDFFVDQKLDLFQKQKLWLLLSDDKIVWVVGYRGDDRFKIDKNTKTYYKITYYGSNE